MVVSFPYFMLQPTPLWTPVGWTALFMAINLYHIWSRNAGVKLRFIRPGKPTRNAFVESFNGKFRDGCLNQHWFRDLLDARRTISAWVHHYNEVRPHSSLGYKPPAVYAREVA
jgi:putative transposase